MQKCYFYQYFESAQKQRLAFLTVKVLPFNLAGQHYVRQSM